MSNFEWAALALLASISYLVARLWDEVKSLRKELNHLWAYNDDAEEREARHQELVRKAGWDPRAGDSPPKRD